MTVSQQSSNSALRNSSAATAHDGGFCLQVAYQLEDERPLAKSHVRAEHMHIDKDVRGLTGEQNLRRSENGLVHSPG
jgi:hypothetical protein